MQPHTRKLLRALPVLALTAGLAVAAAPPAAGQQVDAILKNFEINSDWVLELDGKPVPSAQIYLSERVPAFLVVADELPAPTLLLPGEQSVQTVSFMKLVKRSGDRIDFLADAELSPAGVIRLQGDQVSFTVDGHRALFKERPYLLGEHQLDEMLAHDPGYRRGAAAYAPDTKDLAALKKIGKPVQVKVYFGSWCPHCKHFLPNLLRVAEELEGSKLDFDFYGLPKGFASEPMAVRDEVHAVPTGIVYVGGKEAGRITSDDWSKPEARLRQIVLGS